MKNRLVYENLDTSFVNLSALVRFLCARKFAGKVQIELGEYEGEIFFTTNDEVFAREHDRASGRIAEGEQALQRLLIRAREPGGVVHVHQTVPESPDNSASRHNFNDKSPINADDKRTSTDITETSSPVGIFQQLVPKSNTKTFVENQKTNGATAGNESYERMIFETKSNVKTPDSLLRFSNQVEEKARRNQLSENDWQTLLLLITELLRTIDETLVKNNLNFAAAFQKARAETASDYPFLDPNAETFVYLNEKVEMREQINAKLFASGINETLRRIFEKLAANPKFAEAYRETAQKILALIREHKPLYDQFFITPQLEKILGV